MSDSDPLLALIGDIYDAALDPDLWPDVLRQSCGFIGGVMANLFTQDAVRKNANRVYTWGDDPHYTQLYIEKYAALNPLFPTGMFFPVGEVFGSADIMPHDEMEQSRFYKEWMKPQGYIDFVGSNLEKSSTSAAPFALVRHERDGYVDDEARRRTGAIIPHIRRAILIGKVIDLHKVEAAAMADTLDGLAAGMFLVDAAARIVHANAAGHVMTANDKVFRATAGRIGAVDIAADRILQETFAACGIGDAAVGEQGIAVPLTASDGALYVAHVLPLTSAQRRRASIAYAAVAAVFVQKAGLDALSPMEAFSRKFRLTAAELKVLLAIVNVGGVAEVAEILGIAEGTVRTHLHHLFEKTGARRQVDLVKLVAGFANPLLG
jgi:DNA-binding CsgD family transcriptional regulator